MQSNANVISLTSSEWVFSEVGFPAVSFDAFVFPPELEMIPNLAARSSSLPCPDLEECTNDHCLQG